MKRAGIIVILVVVLGGAIWTSGLLSHPGKKLFGDPRFAGSSNQYSCASCHADGDMIGDIQSKKGFLIVKKSFDSVEEVINEAMIPDYLEGKPVGYKSPEMKDLVDYLKTLKPD